MFSYLFAYTWYYNTYKSKNSGPLRAAENGNKVFVNGTMKNEKRQ